MGAKAKDRPTEFLESAGGIVQWEVICKGAFERYASMCVFLCKAGVFTGVEMCRLGVIWQSERSPFLCGFAHLNVLPVRLATSCFCGSLDRKSVV